MFFSLLLGKSNGLRLGSLLFLDLVAHAIKDALRVQLHEAVVSVAHVHMVMVVLMRRLGSTEQKCEGHQIHFPFHFIIFRINE